MDSLPKTSVCAPHLPAHSQAKALTLQEDKEGAKRLAIEIYRRFNAMKTYGKEPDSLEAINNVFARDLAEFPIDKIELAFKTHSQRSQEFPTVADIVGLIKRNGKPPMTEAQFISISRKDGADRTPEDWQFLRDWEAQNREGWGGEAPDPKKEESSAREVLRLRERVKELEVEVRRLSELLRSERQGKGLERPVPSQEEKIQNTVKAMRESGANEEDIAEFLKPYGLGLHNLTQ